MSDVLIERSAFERANPHALAAILQASETQRILAASDIFDLAGTKLWARHQPVSAALQRKLLDRQLREPLESCLVAEDGVNVAALAEGLVALVEGDSPLVPVLRPWAARLTREVVQLPLHPVAQLLLTAARAARPEAYAHAVAGMALAGALMAEQGGATADLRLALLGGLLHDLGALYIDPQHAEAEADREMDVVRYRQLVVHPHVGRLLLSQLTPYPAALARAVAEHHERLDGSGYPRAFAEERLSPLGRLLAVTEAALNAVGRPGDLLLRASVALRAVPGEFDLHWVGPISRAAGAASQAAPVLDMDDIAARLQALADVMQRAQSAVALRAAAARQVTEQQALALAAYLLDRLRVGWNESGMWNPAALARAEAAEVEAVENELYQRLRGVARATLRAAGELPEDDAAALAAVCASLDMG